MTLCSLIIFKISLAGYGCAGNHYIPDKAVSVLSLVMNIVYQILKASRCVLIDRHVVEL